MKRTLLTLALMLSAAGAQAAVMNFDTTSTGTYTTLTDGDATLTFTGGNGQFAITGASPGAPISGNAAISYFDNPGAAPFMLSFSSLVNYVQVGVGDFNGDVDNTFMQAFDSLNNLIGSDSFVNASTTFGGGFLTIAVENIAYVKFWDAEPFPGAVYWDSITYERGQVPEPSALALLGLGLAGLGFARRRKS